DAPGRGLSSKVYEADPLICPRCGGPLKIISLIDTAPVTERILHHLKRWDRPERPRDLYTIALRLLPSTTSMSGWNSPNRFGALPGMLDCASQRAPHRERYACVRA
ncbi:MAG: hypothetical protein ABSH28_13120, partial [Acidobacteriota bacterium]